MPSASSGWMRYGGFGTAVMTSTWRTSGGSMTYSGRVVLQRLRGKLAGSTTLAAVWRAAQPTPAAQAITQPTTAPAVETNPVRTDITGSPQNHAVSDRPAPIIGLSRTVNEISEYLTDEPGRRAARSGRRARMPGDGPGGPPGRGPGR